MTREYPGVRILPSGAIAYTIREPDHAGIVRHRTITRDQVTGEPFRTPAAAHRARLRHQARIAAGQRPRSRETTGSYARAWLKTRRDLKPASLRVYRYAVEQVVAGLGEIPVADLRPSDVRRFLDALIQRGLAPRSICLIHAVLKMLLDAAVTDELIARNPAQRVHRPGVTKHEVVVWQPDEIRKFLAVADAHPYAALWRLAIETGMRIGELRGLSWRDIDVAAGQLTVRRTATVDDRGRPILGDSPKSPAGRRTLPLSPRVVALLAARRANATSTLVFPGRSGGLLRRDTLGRWFRALVAEAGIRPIRLHDLRHTAATLLLLQGVPAHVVAAVLGHSNPSVTLGVYAHLIPGSTRDALDLLTRYLDAM